jgi:hypothetical protein
VPTLRLLVVDAHHHRVGIRRLAALIEPSGPDLVCVHAAPKGLRWRTVAGALAREAGLVVVGGGRPAGANLLLSSLAVDVAATRDVRLAGARLLRPSAGAALAVLRRQNCAFVVMAAALVGGPADHRAQVAALERALADVASGDLPVVLSVGGAKPLAPPAAEALARSRTALAPGIFVDDRIGAHGVRSVDAEPSVATAHVAELALPD